MKKIYLLFLAMLLPFLSFCQVSSYTFSQSTGAYTEITGGTVLATATGASYATSFDDVVWNLPAGTIPFSFKFNDIIYTGLNVNSNGYITFGATAPSSSGYTPISSSASYAGAVAAWGKDINGAFHSSITSDVSWKVEGVSPNREFVIQYKNVRPGPSTSITTVHAMSFQIRLLENGNVIKFVYGSNTAVLGTTTYSGTAEIGLRGSTNSDFFSRTNTTSVSFTSSTAGTSNSSSQSYNTTTTSTPGMPTSGLTYIFTPPPMCVGVPNAGTVSAFNQIVCSGSTPAAISVPLANSGFWGYVYQWEESDDNGVADAWANAVGGTGATTLTYTPPSFAGTTNKYYRLKTTCTGSGQSTYSTVHTVLMAVSPNAVTALTFTNVGSTSMTIGWTNANGNRRLVVVSPVNTFVARTNGTGAAHTATAAFTGTGEQIVYDGTGSSVTVTGLTCNTTYYVQVYEYLRCGSAAPYSYWYATPLAGNQKPAFFQTAVGLPASTNFVGFTGSNLATVFPGWREATGDGPLTGTTSGWTSSSLLPVATSKVNLWSTGKKEWILSPTLTTTAFSRVKFKAAITDYADSTPASPGMDSDDKVEVMISSDACGATWTPLYTFNAASTTTLTNTLTDFVVNIPASYIGQNFIIGFKATEGTSSGTSDYDFHITNLVIEVTPPPTATTTVVNNVCFGGTTGTAEVIVTNGTPPFTYSWSPSGGTGFKATGLAAGTYTVTVTDANNVTTTATATITEPAAVAGTIAATNVGCNGGSTGAATVTATGGTMPYTYLWNTGATGATLSNLAAGTYSVTITDVNGCTATESVTITEPAVLTTTNSAQTDVSWYGGNDGSATVLASGGTAPYTYSWSNGGTTATISGLIAGTYTVTVTDANGCTSTLDFVIIQPIPLMVQSVSQTNVSCNAGANGTATIVAMGGNAPYTYAWSPIGGTSSTASGLSSGTYSVLVTDSTGNTITESYTITEPAAIVATTTKTDITCNFASNGTATVSVTGGTAPYTYFWSNGMTSATATNLNVGTYSVQITDANGCKATATVSITQPAALVATVTSTNITCFGQIDGTASVSVTGGTSPYTYAWSNGQVGTSLTGLSKGTYTLTVTDANGCTSTKVVTITEPAFVYPPIASNQNFCIGQNATLANVVITGSNIKWYSTATAGVLLPSSTVLTNGTTYYASQTVGSCESATRTAVQITLNQGTPLTTTQLNVCGNTRIQGVMIDGFNYTQLKWYSSATSTAQLASSLLLSTGTYYVSSVVGTCESSRQAIQVTVAAIVPAPTAAAQTACGSATLNDLTVVKDPSATLRWYSSLQSITPLSGTTQVSTGTYYVQQVIGNCESVRIAVPVQVVTATVPTMTSITTCDGTVIGDLHPSTGKYVWYVNNITTTSLPDTFVITSGSYYIAHEVQGCISSRVNVAVNVGARPTSPTGQTTQSFGFAARISDLVMNQPNVSWYASYNDALMQVNELGKTTTLQDTFTYYGILKSANNCGSYPTAVTVSINVSTNELDLAQLKYYPNPVDSELNINYIDEIKKVEVFTITGQRVFGNDYQSNEVKVDLNRLSAGTYLVKIETAKASQFVKIVKR